MKCPTDGSVLKSDKTEDHTGYGCVSCKGSWLPKSYIYSIKYTKDFEPQKFFNELSATTNEIIHSKCPSSCGFLSTTTDSKGISYCTSCYGVWFEENALKEMLKRYNNKNSKLASTDIPNTTIGFFDVLGALFK